MESLLVGWMREAVLDMAKGKERYA